MTSSDVHLQALIDNNWTSEQKAQMNGLLDSFRVVFSRSQYDLGHSTVIKQEINTGHNTPFKSKQYVLPEALNYETRKIIASMLEN